MASCSPMGGSTRQIIPMKPLLFLSEEALPNRAEQLNLLGSQWGMMNETGAYPGQAWLWLYTFWYSSAVWSF